MLLCRPSTNVDRRASSLIRERLRAVPLLALDIRLIGCIGVGNGVFLRAFTLLHVGSAGLIIIWISENPSFMDNYL